MKPFLGLAAAATLLVAASPSLCQTSAQSGDAQPFTLEDPGHSEGFVSGPFSPSGAQMVVYRLSETDWA